MTRLMAWFAAFSCILLLIPSHAAAEFPERPIRLIVPFAAGGAMDIMARDIGSVLAERLKQTVTVENVTGGGTVVGSQRVVSAVPDGYTLLFQSGAVTIDLTFRKNPPYDVRKDLLPITKAAWGPFAVLVSPFIPVRSLSALVAYAKKHPGKLNYGSSGTGAGMHLITEYLKAAAKFDIVHIPFRGEAPATTALLSGEVQMMLKPPFTALPLIREGKAVALAVTGKERSVLLDAVPTISEAGYKDFVAGYWGGFFAPAGTPQAVINKLHAEIVASVRDKRVVERLRKSGEIVVANSPERFKAEIEEEIALWRAVITKSGIEPQ
jgi:tripartite-type tricarboxylate transporter receptor subunit TctC